VSAKSVPRLDEEVPMLTDQLTTEMLGILLDAAEAAPSLTLRRRPWRLEVNGHLIDAYLDGSSVLPATNPDGRAGRIATGAAVLNLRCAAASQGFGTWVSLCPYPYDPDLMARIVVEPTGLPDEGLRHLYGAILSRHLPRPRTAPGATVRLAVEQAAQIENTHLRWLPVSWAPVAVLSTDRDDPADQVAAGIALQRVLLTATRQDMYASYLTQPLARNELRRCAQQLTGHLGFAQTLIRFGCDRSQTRTDLR